MLIRAFFLLVTFFTVPATAFGGVVISELHRDPSAGNKTAIPGGYSHTFIELANFGPDTFFLRDVFLTNGKVVDSITLFDAPVPGHDACVFGAAYIPPGGIAVVLPQNYPGALEIAPSTIFQIPPGTTMLTVNHKNIGGGVANDDGIALYRGTRARIDSLVDLAADPGVYVSSPLSGKIVLSAKQTKGSSVVPVSLLLGERRYAVSPKEPLSPGRFESYENGIYIEYRASMAAASARCSLAGIFVAEKGESAAWRLYSRQSGAPGGGAAEIEKGVFGPRRDFLLVFDIALEQRQYFFEVRPGGGQTVTVPIDLSGFWADAGTLRITELYPKGSASAGQPEWFEVLNVSRAAVNLNGWMFGNSKDSAVITTSDVILPPGHFLVACKDDAAMLRKYPQIDNIVKPARWHTLNSYNDTVCLWSPRGVLVDRAVYRSAWFSGWASQSLERVLEGRSGSDSASWVLCPRPTPGAPGGAETWRAVSAPSVEIGPVPFSPNGDGFDDFLSIRVKAPPDYRVKVRIFGFDGKLIRAFAGESEVVQWDGRTDAGRMAAPGAVYVVVEFTSGGGGVRKIIRKNGVVWR